MSDVGDERQEAGTRATLDDVLSFSLVGLNLDLYDWQQLCCEVIDRGAREERIKVALVAPNGSGKTQRVVGVSTLRWLNKWPKGRVIITSADSKQLDSQLMPALTEHKNKFPAWEFLQRSIRTPQGGFMRAFTTDDSARAEGHHATPESPLLIIVDEAKSVEPQIFEAFDRCSFSVILYISSPGIRAGRFFQAFSDHRASFILTQQVGLADCPHITQARIDDVIQTYGADAEFTKSTLYGEFMNQEEGGQFAFSFEAVTNLIAMPPHARISKLEYSAFCDFAAGRDENVLAIRSGNKLIELEAWKDKNTVAAVGRFIMLFRRYGLKSSQIWGDNGGIGHSMIDMLNDAGWPINRFDFGAPANRKEQFVSRGAEIWLSLSRQVIKQEVVLINDPTLVSQLVTRRITNDGRGRIKLETKEELDARGLRSPDRADAVIGAFAHGSPNYLTYARYPSPWEQMDQLEDPVEAINGRIAQQKMGAWCGD
jgi:hypothetical protein